MIRYVAFNKTHALNSNTYDYTPYFKIDYPIKYIQVYIGMTISYYNTLYILIPEQ